MTARTMTAESRRWRIGRWIVEQSADDELWVELAADPARRLVLTDANVRGLGLGVSTVAELAALVETWVPAPAAAKPTESRTLRTPAGKLRWVDTDGETLPPARRRP